MPSDLKVFLLVESSGSGSESTLSYMHGHVKKKKEQLTH